MDLFTAAFAGWDSFFFMVGSSAAGLIGLTFVVLTLLAERPLRGVAEAGAAFLTPTIVHFGVALLLSAVLLAPWQTVAVPAALLGIIGFGGMVYVGIIPIRIRRQKVYRPELEDWLFHVALPFAAYAVLVLSSFATPSHVSGALFGVGAASLLLLFIGIHNAWDNVAYHVFIRTTSRVPDENAGNDRP
jgi:hypothetical protein